MGEPMSNNPEFIIYTGPMWGSKTTRLIAAMDRLKLQGRKVIAYKPTMDSRYSLSQISTHSGAKWPAHCVNSGDMLWNHYSAYSDPIDAVAIDEAFMIDGVSSAALQILRRGTSVMIASLDLSARCKPFEEIERLMPYATRIEKCSAVCPVCGDDAYYTAKLSESQAEIEVGGRNLYEPRCFRHHPIMCNSAEPVE
jgi:thymidine kinase